MQNLKNSRATSNSDSAITISTRAGIANYDSAIYTYIYIYNMRMYLSLFPSTWPAPTQSSALRRNIYSSALELTLHKCWLLYMTSTMHHPRDSLSYPPRVWLKFSSRQLVNWWNIKQVYYKRISWWETANGRPLSQLQ